MAVVGSAYIVVNAITTGFKDDIEDILDGLESKFASAGRSFGAGFTRNAASSLSSFEKEAIATYQSINGLIEKSYYLQGAVGALLPALGAAAAGITVIGLEAAAAAPSFIVLGGVIAAFIQGMGAFKLAFSGVGKAIGSLTKPGGGVDRMPQLLRAATAAQDRYDDSTKRLVKATLALTDAREAARREIEKLKYDNEDAVISEKRAVIELEKARESLLRVQDLPPNNRARREAELAYAEADLNLRRARSSTRDLQKDLNKATKDGTLSAEEQIENSQTVRNAIEAEADAQRDLKRATDAKLLADKELADAKAGKGTGGGGADPMAGLNEYQKEFARFIAGLKPQLDKLKLSVSEGLLPALQEAITIINTRLFSTIDEKLKGTGIALGKAAKDFAERITSPNAIKNLGTIMDTNNYVLSNTGIVLGNLARLFEALLAAASPLIKRFTDWIRDLTGGWAKSAEGNISGLTDMFNHAGDIAAGFGDAIGNIVGAFMNMGRAVTGADGAGQTMLDWLVNLTQRFEDFTSKHLASGKLKEYFDIAWQGFQGMLTIIGNIIQAILRAGGDKSLDGMVKNIGEGVGKLIEKMPELIAGGVAFAEFLGKFLGMVATFLESGSVQAFFGVVGKAIEILTKFLNLPGVSNILLYVAAMHGLRLGVGRVAKGFETLGKYVAGDYFNFKKLAKNASSAFDAIKGKTSLLTDGFKYARSGGAGFFASLKAGVSNTKTFQTLFGQNSKMLAYFRTGLLKVTGPMKALWATMSANPITIWIVAIVALIAILVVMYKKFEWFRDFVHTVWSGIKAGLDLLWEGIKFVGEKIGQFFSAVWDKVKVAAGIAWDGIKAGVDFLWEGIKFVAEKIGGFFATVWGGIRAAWDAVWPALVIAFKIAVGLIMLPFVLMGIVVMNVFKSLKNTWDTVWPLIYNSIQFAWNNIIKPVFEIFGVVVGAVWEAMKVAFETAWNIITTSIDFAWNSIIKPIFDLILSVWGLVWEGIKLYYSTVWDIITTGISFAWNYVIKPIFGFFGSVWETVWSGIKKAFTFVWDYIKELVSFYWERVIKPVFGFIGEVWGKVWDGIKTAFTKAWDFITKVVDGAKAIFGKIGDAIINTFKSAINFIIRAWNAIEFKVPSMTLFGKTIGGFTVGLPDIPELADGGVIMPSPGGTLARIGEAGRAERVEPLDKDGLSKRDRAIISMLAGGQGGVTVNVHPSPGMDEIELASVVSRQLALQLRRGSA
jgi:phage-related protein